MKLIGGILTCGVAIVLLSSCAQTLKVANIEDIQKNTEFENQVQIETVSPDAGLPVSPSGLPYDPLAPTPTQDERSKGTAESSLTSAKGNLALKKGTSIEKGQKGERRKGDRKQKETKDKQATVKSEGAGGVSPGRSSVLIKPRQPEIESSVGFIPGQRRPLVDPFRVGEKVTHAVRYMGIKAGTLTFETLPFVKVNGRFNYNFKVSIGTSSLFSMHYSVDDFVTTLVDFETLLPSVFKLSVRETAQVKEAQAFFDQEKRKAIYWEKKVTKAEGTTDKKLEWDLEEYAQNVFSAIFYMRVFTWNEGMQNAFRVASESENMVFKAKVIRKETIKTDVGEKKAVVLQPEFELKGQYKPTGENLIWLSDDDRKFILKIEAKVKIGTLVSEVTELNP